MTDAEIQALVGALAPVFKGYVESLFAPLQGRIAVLEARAPAPDQAAMVAALRPELDGLAQRLAADLGGAQGAALAPVIARVDQLEARAPVAGPPGEPGAPGQPGKDAPPVDPVALQGVIDRVVAETVIREAPSLVAPVIARVDQLEARAPVAGPPGEPGAPGQPGNPGRDAPCLAELEEILQRMVSAIPPAQPGKDGVGVAGTMLSREGHLVVTLSNGEQKDLGPVVGKNGQDGITWDFDDFTAELDDDGRTLVLGFKGGDVVHTTKEFRLVLPIPIDRGVYKPGEYKRGDAVSWGGSMWIAQKDTDQQPEAGTDWRLAVKRGRNGNDFAPKPPKTHTPVKLGDGK